jgi:hypothetical protein
MSIRTLHSPASRPAGVRDGEGPKIALDFPFFVRYSPLELEVATLSTTDPRSVVHSVFNPTNVTRKNDPVCMSASSQEVWTAA